MPRLKPSTKRITRKKYGDPGRSKSIKAYMKASSLMKASAEEKRQLYAIRRQRRIDERRSKDRDHKRRLRATMSAEELQKLRERDALQKRNYRANLTKEKLMKCREQDRQRKRKMRAMLAAKDFDKKKKKGNKPLAALRSKRATKADNDVSPTRRQKGLSKIKENYALQKRIQRSNLTLEEQLAVRERDKLRKRIQRAQQSEVLVDSKPIHATNNGNDVPITTAISKRGRKIKKTVKFA